jgi:hypothetical protein
VQKACQRKYSGISAPASRPCRLRRGILRGGSQRLCRVRRRRRAQRETALGGGDKKGRVEYVFGFPDGLLAREAEILRVHRALPDTAKTQTVHSPGLADTGEGAVQVYGSAVDRGMFRRPGRGRGKRVRKRRGNAGSLLARYCARSFFLYISLSRNEGVKRNAASNQ